MTRSMQGAVALPRRRILPPTLFAAAVTTLLVWGYTGREDIVLSAESGLGYLLGIAGLSCMVLLLTYPLAKRQRAMQRLLSIKHWFRLHMVLGIVGPAAILFHCNFQQGSMNSTVALYCMLLVMGSGLIGRYFYSKVHMGLYGSKATSGELLGIARQQKQLLLEGFAGFADVQTRINTLYDKLLPQDIARMSISRVLLAAPRRAWHYRAIEKSIRQHHNAELDATWRASRQTLKQYLDTLRKLAELSFFERVLSWWHILHLPFFFMMLITATIHIWAVHRY